MRTRVVLAAGLLGSMAVLSACLGPTEFDPTGTAPIGSLDFAVADGASIRVVGWAIDPDTTAPVEVMVSSRQVATAHRADRNRPDVAAVHPRYGAAHGFDARTQPLPSGKNQVCVWVPNVGRGSQDRLLGCTDVVVTGNDDATGGFETLAKLSQTRIRAIGWAYDPEAPGSIDVTVELNGVALPRTAASVFRQDLQSRFRKSGNHGFVVDLTVGVGDHEVCVTAHNVGRGKDANLGCRSVQINSIPVVGPGAGVSSVDLVGPAPGSPLSGIDRDAGISTRLADGSVLWIFGDSSAGDDDGNFRYFVNNTAAWATAAQPTVTRDGSTPDERPYPFVVPVEPFDVSCPAGWSEVMWPTSVIALPPEGADETQRVVAYFSNVCLSGNSARARGISVSEWTYDPTAPPDGVALQGQVTEQNLFPTGSEYGTAALFEDGWVYAYECGRPTDGRPEIIWPNDPEYTGCTIARVAPDDVSDAAAYRYWTGADWSAEPDDAVPMEMPGDPNGDKQLPVVSLTVVDDPHFGHTMVYSPWPGFTNEVAIRTAPGPLGPWSERTIVQLPNCFEWAAGSEKLCYAATAQPWRSTPGQLGIGYYDQFVADSPVRGSYLAASAPFGG